MGRPPKHLSVVKPLQERIDGATAKIRSGVAFRECDLIREFDLSRGIIVALIKDFAPPGRPIKLRQPRKATAIAQALLPFHEPLLPLPLSAAPAASAGDPKPIVGRTYSQIFWGIVAAWIGLVLGASGIIVNCQYWYAVGGNNLTVSLIFCAMGGAADVITIAIPSWATELWKRGNWMLSIIVAIFFIPIALISVIASAGFSGTHIGDTTQVRSDTMTSKKDLIALLEQKKAERASIKITDLPEVIEIQIQDERGRIPRDNLRWSKDCTDTTYSSLACSMLKQLRSDKLKAQRRIDLDAEIKQMTAKYGEMPSISSKDPAAEHASQMTFGYVSPEAFENYLINALAAAPIFAGLFFMVVTALWR